MKSGNALNQKCGSCGRMFTCGVKAGHARCWCEDLPHAAPVKENGGCLCRACLEKQIKTGIHQKSAI